MSSAARPAVLLAGTEIRIGGATILGPIDLRVEPGERWIVMGPNGSGKTTLLTLAGARRQPSRGRAEVLGVVLGEGDIRTVHPRIGHASHALADRMQAHMSVGDVVLTGRDAVLATWFRDLGDADRERAAQGLADVGCAHLIGRPMRSCSQGERQRVLLARAMFGRPDLLILDEPAAALDLPAREHLVAALESSLARTDAPALLMATHHLEEIPPSATHALLLRAGRTVAAGPIATALTATSLGTSFDLDVEIGRRAGRWWAAVRR